MLERVPNGNDDWRPHAKSRSLGELATPFGLTLNGVKKHVGILEEVDLVVTEKVGRARECQLGPAQLEDATTWIDEKHDPSWKSRSTMFGAQFGGELASDPSNGMPNGKTPPSPPMST